jgi:cell division protein FtsL
MNAAARMIHQTTLFNGQISDMQMSKMTWCIIVSFFAVLLSGLSVIYTTNAYRLTYSQVQLAEQQQHALQLQKGQLLLEQASLRTPARVEDAVAKLDMQLPQPQNTLVLRARE